ncbi:MAG TPA: hypothetical protein VIM08_11550 [Arthrobacter sp.]
MTITGQQVSIALGNGQNVTCTYTNHYTNSPTIATTLSSTSVPVGSTVHDSSTFTGATSNAGGTVTYSAYAGANTCTGTDLLNSVKTVTNGTVPDSDGVTLTSAGTYSFQAVYSGDANNSGATSDCTTEQLVVTKTQPTVATTQDLIPNDNFILSAGFGTPSGSITFNLYAPSDATCSQAPALTQTVTVSGNGTYSTTNTTFHSTAAGTWRWASSYTGDANNLPAASACGVEQFTIVNSAP